MTKKENNTSRRNFMKAAGMAACLPFAGSLHAFGNVPLQKKSSLHRVLTCNIRVALPEDAEKGVGWEDRKAICMKVVKSYQPDIVCFQEVIKIQADDLKKSFKDYMLFGFEGPYMDAHPEGYHFVAKNPILFSISRYELIAGGTYWLSDTPLIAGSKSWGTARARHANWVRLKDKKSAREFRVVNTHLDHVAQDAREKQIKTIMDECGQYPTDFLQVLTGDFNSSMANNVYHIIKENGWKDTYTEINGDAEPGYTVHQFQGENYPKKDKGRKIDFILSKGNITSKASKIIKNSIGGHYPSDHYFVSADLIF